MSLFLAASLEFTKPFPIHYILNPHDNPMMQVALVGLHFIDEETEVW